MTGDTSRGHKALLLTDGAEREALIGALSGVLDYARWRAAGVDADPETTVHVFRKSVRRARSRVRFSEPLMSRKKADELGVKPLARILGYSSGGLDPAYMGLGPVPAVRKVLQSTGLSLAEIDRIELAVEHVTVPPSFAASAYELRLHIDFLRQRIDAGGGEAEPVSE